MERVNVNGFAGYVWLTVEKDSKPSAGDLDGIVLNIGYEVGVTGDQGGNGSESKNRALFAILVLTLISLFVLLLLVVYGIIEIEPLITGLGKDRDGKDGATIPDSKKDELNGQDVGETSVGEDKAGTAPGGDAVIEEEGEEVAGIEDVEVVELEIEGGTGEVVEGEEEKVSIEIEDEVERDVSIGIDEEIEGEESIEIGEKVEAEEDTEIEEEIGDEKGIAIEEEMKGERNEIEEGMKDKNCIEIEVAEKELDPMEIVAGVEKGGTLELDSTKEGEGSATGSPLGSQDEGDEGEGK